MAAARVFDMRAGLALAGLSLALISCSPTQHKITYRVIGSPDWKKEHPDLPSEIAKVRMVNKSGGMDELGVFLPWSQDDIVTSGDRVFLSAQLDQADEDYIECQILIDGRLARASHSSGRFAIADCSGRI